MSINMRERNNKGRFIKKGSVRDDPQSGASHPLREKAEKKTKKGGKRRDNKGRFI